MQNSRKWELTCRTNQISGWPGEEATLRAQEERIPEAPTKPLRGDAYVHYLNCGNGVMAKLIQLYTLSTRRLLNVSHTSPKLCIKINMGSYYICLFNL